MGWACTLSVKPDEIGIESCNEFIVIGIETCDEFAESTSAHRIDLE